jgi:uncharacterized repeat protein (TIGR03803 family)
MTNVRIHSAIFIVGAVVFLVMLSSSSAAVTEQVIYSFPGKAASFPASNLVFNADASRLYGTAASGGLYACSGGCGSVSELIYNAGSWNPHLLYAFKGGSDGSNPAGNIVFDSAGNLYGVTQSGGSFGLGAVYKLTPGADSNSRWTENIIYSFQGNSDGSQPFAGLTMDSAGNLYGTTNFGGTNGVGTVYELTPAEGGSWTESVLHSFGQGQDGAYCWAEVILDSSGNLYGTTVLGGADGGGTVYELSPGSGGWTEQVLYSFTGSSDSGIPKAPVWLDASGNLYGTASGDGTGSPGAVFELSPNSDGTWTEHTLHMFGSQGDGSTPLSGLTPDTSGNLYGTTYVGGAHGAGTVYQVRLASDGKWSEGVVYSFAGSDGNAPHTGVTIGKGVLFGTTAEGGAADSGVVFGIER